MELMRTPDGTLAVKMAALVLSGNEFCTTVFHLYCPDTNLEMAGLNCTNCQTIPGVILFKNFLTLT